MPESKNVHPKEWFNSLETDECFLLLEASYQLYKDANLYEWLCNTLDIEPDEKEGLFLRLKEYMEA